MGSPGGRRCPCLAVPSTGKQPCEACDKGPEQGNSVALQGRLIEDAGPPAAQSHGTPDHLGRLPVDSTRVQTGVFT